MLDCKETGINKALGNLKETKVQEQLAEIFSTYCFDLHNILTIATVHNSGVRPEGLSNEIYSCFHHIARGLCVPDANVESELKSATKSHIKRAILDSYKIAINSILREDEALRKTLDYLVLVEDFSKFIPDGMAKVNEIKTLSQSVKLHYSEAKKFEAKADFEKAIEKYNVTYAECLNLLKLLEIFTKDRVYLLACAREAEKTKERKKDRFAIIFAAFLGACITAPITVISTNYLDPHLKANAENSKLANVMTEQANTFSVKKP